MSRYTSVEDFDVAGYKVSAPYRINDFVVFGADHYATIEGRVQADGTILATQTYDTGPGPDRYLWTEVHAPVDAIDSAAGTLTILGFPVVTRASTIIADRSGASAQALPLSAIQVGDWVRVGGGALASPDVLIATVVEKEPVRPAPRVMSDLYTLAAPEVTVLGRSIQVATPSLFSGAVTPICYRIGLSITATTPTLTGDFTDSFWNCDPNL